MGGAISGLYIEAGLLHLLFGPALQLLHGARDRPELVGLSVKEDSVLLRLVAAETILGGGLGEHVQRLGVGVEEPALLRVRVPGFEALVEVLEVLDELQCPER